MNRKLQCKDGILPTRIFTHRKEVEEVNQRELIGLPGEAREFTAVDSGEPAGLFMLQSNCTAKTKLRLKLGAQVILIKTTNADEGLVNGARGVVVKFTR